MRTLLFALALVVIPVAADAQNPSADYWRARAEEGEAIAQYNLGVMYADGRGVPQDDVEAVRWYQLAADQGEPLAQVSLGLMYGKGDGVPQDTVLAHMWWSLAAAQGNEDAREIKDRIEKVMTREQIAEAQRLSREWIAAHPPGGN